MLWPTKEFHEFHNSKWSFDQIINNNYSVSLTRKTFAIFINNKFPSINSNASCARKAAFSNRAIHSKNQMFGWETQSVCLRHTHTGATRIFWRLSAASQRRSHTHTHGHVQRSRQRSNSVSEWLKANHSVCGNDNGWTNIVRSRDFYCFLNFKKDRKKFKKKQQEQTNWSEYSIWCARTTHSANQNRRRKRIGERRAN